MSKRKSNGVINRVPHEANKLSKRSVQFLIFKAKEDLKKNEIGFTESKTD